MNPINYLDLLDTCHVCSKRSAVFALNIHELNRRQDYKLSQSERVVENTLRGAIYPLCVDCASKTDYTPLIVVPFGKDVINWDAVRIKQVESVL